MLIINKSKRDIFPHYSELDMRIPYLEIVV